jgi:selenocysteine-specific elongation factor
MIDAKVRLLASAPRKLPRSSTVKLYIATGQQVVRMALIDKPTLAPGDEGYAQFRSEKPLCAFRGDRFVIRGESPEITLGGGVILDAAPTKAKRRSLDKVPWLEKLEKAAAAEAALAFLSQREMGTSLRAIAVRMGEPFEKVYAMIEEGIQNGSVIAFGAGAETLLISRERFEQLKSKVIDELTNAGKIETVREGITLKGRKAGITEPQKALKEKIEKVYRDAGFSPPTFSQAEEQLGDIAPARQMQSLLVEEGILIKISSTMAYHKDFLGTAMEKIREHFQKVDKLAVGDLKNILGISRKHAVPLLEYFDKIGFTARVGDYRILKQKAHR